MITLTGQVPSNQKIYLQRGKMRFMKKEAKELKARWVEEVKPQWLRDPMPGDVEIDITYYHGSRTKRDIDNYGKLVLDCMTGIVYEDDSQIVEMNLKKFYDKSNPRVEIVVRNW